MSRILVTGASGFVGHHLVTYLKRMGDWVRAVDLSPPPYARSHADEFLSLDLRRWGNCLRATVNIDEVYALAADAGAVDVGVQSRARIACDNTLISRNTFNAACINGVKQYLFTPSADLGTAYPQFRVGRELEENITECFSNPGGIETHNACPQGVFGPLGPWDGGRETTPAALCRKVALAKLSGNRAITICGDGQQQYSFCYVDDCVAGMYRLMRADCRRPISFGQSAWITLDQLAHKVASIAGIEITLAHLSQLPGSAGGLELDDRRYESRLEWEPQVGLEEGLARTYRWVEMEVRKVYSAAANDREPSLSAPN